MQQRVKLYRNGRSQTVRLPVAFSFKGDAVYIRRDEKTGDVVLSQCGSSWGDLFARLDSFGDFPDYMRDRSQGTEQERELF